MVPLRDALTQKNESTIISQCSGLAGSEKVILLHPNLREIKRISLSANTETGLLLPSGCREIFLNWLFPSLVIGSGDGQEIHKIGDSKRAIALNILIIQETSHASAAPG